MCSNYIVQKFAYLRARSRSGYNCWGLQFVLMPIHIIIHNVYSESREINTYCGHCMLITIIKEYVCYAVKFSQKEGYVRRSLIRLWYAIGISKAYFCERYSRYYRFWFASSMLLSRCSSEKKTLSIIVQWAFCHGYFYIIYAFILDLEYFHYLDRISIFFQ